MRFSELLCRNASVSSRLLRFVMWSMWSHSAILDHVTGKVYDSTFWHKGVKEWDHDEFVARYTHMSLRPILVQVERELEALTWLKAQIGKRYDWSALLGFLPRLDWQEDDAWFCSELTETFRALFSKPRFSLRASRITPAHQDMVL